MADKPEQEQLCEFLQGFQKNKKLDLQKAIAERAEQHNLLEEEIFDLDLKIAETKEEKETTEQNIYSRQIHFEEDFESIMSMDGIRKIETSANGKFTFLTKRLFQTIDHHSFDIGQQMFVVNYSPSGHREEGLNKIHFYQGPYRGTFEHAHAKENQTCFGNTSDHGLNHIVTKHVVDFELVGLVHLMLTFLQRESTIPSPPSPHKQWTNDEIEYSESLDEGYATEQERNQEKKKFVSACVDVALRDNTEFLQKKLSILEKLGTRKNSAFIKKRHDLNVLNFRLHIVESTDCAGIAEKEYFELRRIPEFIELCADESQLLLFLKVRNNNITIEMGHHAPVKIESPIGIFPVFRDSAGHFYKKLKSLKNGMQFSVLARETIDLWNIEGGKNDQ